MKTTYKHIAEGRTVEKPWTSLGTTAAFGRSRITIICPFCSGHVTAYLWSLAGGGTRCPCGAMLGHYGKAYRLKTMEEQLAQLPDTGFTEGEESNAVAEDIAAHPETWTPIVLP